MIIDFNNQLGSIKGISFTAEELLAKMDEAKIDKAVVFSFPEKINNDYICEVCEKYPKRLIGFVTVNPWDDQAEEQLEYYLGNKKLKGIKLHSFKHGFNFDNHTLLDPLFMVAEKYGVPIMAYGAANVLCVPNMFEEMAQSFPKVKLIMEHSGQMYETKPAIGVAARNSNVYLETSTVFTINIEKQIKDVGYNRILMGTNMPYGEYDLEMLKISSATSDEKILEAIFGGNALELIGGRQI